MTDNRGKQANCSSEIGDFCSELIKVALGWDMIDDIDLDLDACAFCLTEQGRVRNEDDFIFYNHLRTADGAIVHTGDNRTGAGEGDDEVILIDLSGVASEISQIVFYVTIHQARQRQHCFKMVSNAFIRLVSLCSNEERAYLQLSGSDKPAIALQFGCLLRNEHRWQFSNSSQYLDQELAQICAGYGILAR